MAPSPPSRYTGAPSRTLTAGQSWRVPWPGNDRAWEARAGPPRQNPRMSSVALPDIQQLTLPFGYRPTPENVHAASTSRGWATTWADARTAWRAAILRLARWRNESGRRRWMHPCGVAAMKALRIQRQPFIHDSPGPQLSDWGAGAGGERAGAVKALIGGAGWLMPPLTLNCGLPTTAPPEGVARTVIEYCQSPRRSSGRWTGQTGCTHLSDDPADQVAVIDPADAIDGRGARLTPAPPSSRSAPAHRSLLGALAPQEPRSLSLDHFAPRVLRPVAWTAEPSGGRRRSQRSPRPLRSAALRVSPPRCCAQYAHAGAPGSTRRAGARARGGYRSGSCRCRRARAYPGGSPVTASGQQMGREAVAQRLRAHALRQARAGGMALDDLVQPGPTIGLRAG